MLDSAQQRDSVSKQGQNEDIENCNDLNERATAKEDSPKEASTINRDNLRDEVQMDDVPLVSPSEPPSAALATSRILPAQYSLKEIVTRPEVPFSAAIAPSEPVPTMD